MISTSSSSNLIMEVSKTVEAAAEAAEEETEAGDWK